MLDKYLKELGIDCRIVKGKKVFIFESHQYALYPWALVKRDYENKEIDLLSVDYHTDTIDAFLRYAANVSGGELNYDLMNELVENIDYRDDSSLVQAIGRLQNDEHIKAAIRSGILKHAFIISLSGHETPISFEEKERIDNVNTPEARMQMIMGTYQITPKEKRTYPESDIYMPELKCTDADEVIEDGFLDYHIKELSRISGLINEQGKFTSRYILDIDLDYFTSVQAIEPKSYNVFSHLIQEAEAITVAMEHTCVEMCSDYKTNSDELLKKLMSIIDNSL